MLCAVETDCCQMSRNVCWQTPVFPRNLDNWLSAGLTQRFLLIGDHIPHSLDLTPPHDLTGTPDPHSDVMHQSLGSHHMAVQITFYIQHTFSEDILCNNSLNWWLVTTTQVIAMQYYDPVVGA